MIAHLNLYSPFYGLTRSSTESCSITRECRYRNFAYPDGPDQTEQSPSADLRAAELSPARLLPSDFFLRRGLGTLMAGVFLLYRLRSPSEAGQVPIRVYTSQESTLINAFRLFRDALEGSASRILLVNKTLYVPTPRYLSCCRLAFTYSENNRVIPGPLELGFPNSTRQAQAAFLEDVPLQVSL